MLKSNPTISSKIFSVFKRDIFIFISNILTSAIIARSLGPNILGIWTILSLISAYGEAFGRTKADVASVYIISSRRFNLKEVVTNLNLITFCGLILFILLFLFFYKFIYSWIFQNIKVDYTIEVWYMIFHLSIYFFYLNYLYFFLAVDKIGVHNKMVLIRTWTLTILSITLILFTNLGILALIIATIISTSISLFYGVWKSNKKMFYFENVNLILIKEMLIYSKSIYISGLMTQLQQSSVRLISSKYLMPSSIAFLGQGENITALLNKIIEPINAIMYPEISRSGISSAVNRSLITFRLITLVLVFPVIFMYIFIAPLIHLLYGESFLIVANLVYIILPGLFINGIGSIFTNYFNGTGNAKVIPQTIAIPLVVQIFVAFLFLPNFGLIGCSFIISFGFALNGFVTIGYFSFITKCKLKEFVPTKSDINILFQILIKLSPLKNSIK